MPVREPRQRPAGERRSTALLMFGIVLLSAADAFSTQSGQSIGQLGTVKVYALDVATLFLALAAGARAALRRSWGLADILLVSLALYSFVRFAMGFSQHALAAGVAFRRDALVLATALFVSQTAGRISLRNFLLICLLIAIAPALIYLGRAAGFLPMVGRDFFASRGDFRSIRYINVDSASLLVPLGIGCLVLGRRLTFGKAWLVTIVGLGLLIMMVADMNRSLWASAAISLIALFCLEVRAGLMTKWRAVLSGLAVWLGLVAAYSLRNFSELLGAVQELGRYNSTFTWRAQGWLALLARMEPQEYLFGRAYGADMKRVVMGQLIDVAAHNFYVEKIFDIGLAGLFLYLWLCALIIKWLWTESARSTAARDPALAVLLLALLLGCLAYFGSYDIWTPMALLMGYSLAYMRDGLSAPSQTRASLTEERWRARARSFARA